MDVNSEEREVSVIFKNNENVEVPGTAVLMMFSQEAAQRRAIKTAGILFALALCSVFLPLAHFVLVPLFLLLTPISFILLRKVRSKIVKIDGECPFCLTKLYVSNQPARWPQQTLCTKCRKLFQITPSAEGEFQAP